MRSSVVNFAIWNDFLSCFLFDLPNFLLPSSYTRGAIPPRDDVFGQNSYASEAEIASGPNFSQQRFLNPGDFVLANHHRQAIMRERIKLQKTGRENRQCFAWDYVIYVFSFDLSHWLQCASQEPPVRLGKKLLLVDLISSREKCLRCNLFITAFTRWQRATGEHSPGEEKTHGNASLICLHSALRIIIRMFFFSTALIPSGVGCSNTLPPTWSATHIETIK